MRSGKERYGLVARALHWVTAGAIVFAVMTVVRVIWRFIEPTPEHPVMSKWRHLAFLGNHYALYVQVHPDYRLTPASCLKNGDIKE